MRFLAFWLGSSLLLVVGCVLVEFGNVLLMLFVVFLLETLGILFGFLVCFYGLVVLLVFVSVLLVTFVMFSFSALFSIWTFGIWVWSWLCLVVGHVVLFLFLCF